MLLSPSLASTVCCAEWMKDPYILEMTASEPLSLEEEYAMQGSWRDDSRKCTFIVLASTALYRYVRGYDAVDGDEDDEVVRMIGDVNLFLNDRDDDMSVAEIEVMIAEHDFRRKGCATKALQLLMHYAHNTLGIMRFYAKISESNVDSINLFRDRLHYREVNYVGAFGEYEYEFLVTAGDNDDDATAKVRALVNSDYAYGRAAPYEGDDSDWESAPSTRSNE